jgi:ABC-2 type transport system ATP-binding protein
MPAALVFDRISKHFGAAHALEEVSFTIEPGEILGLVGPNGAGKTTALQIAAGFLLPSAGMGRLMDEPFSSAAARRQLGFVPDAPVFFAGNAMDAVAFAAHLSDAPAARTSIEAVLRRVGLHEWKRDVRRLSRGMQQRLALAQALIHAPRVLVLDEPASALDPEGVVDVRRLLAALRREGVSILLSSHQLNEVAQLSDRIAFLHQGRLLRYGRLEELLGTADRMEVRLRHLQPDAEFTRTWGVAGDGGPWQISAADTRRFLEAAWGREAELLSVTPVRGDLTELFLTWTRGESWTGEEPNGSDEGRS